MDKQQVSRYSYSHIISITPPNLPLPPQQVTEVYNLARKELQEPEVPSDRVPGLIVFLAQLAAEKLPGTRDEDPMQLYLQRVEEHFMLRTQVIVQVGQAGGRRVLRLRAMGRREGVCQSRLREGCGGVLL
jgi:hypothetical protein